MAADDDSEPAQDDLSAEARADVAHEFERLLRERYPGVAWHVSTGDSAAAEPTGEAS